MLTNSERAALDPGVHDQRNGFVIASTDQNGEYADLYAASCACWALFGRYVSDDDQKHPNTLYFDLFETAEVLIGTYDHPRGKDDKVIATQHGKTRTVDIPKRIAGLSRFDDKYAHLTKAVRDNFGQAAQDSVAQLEAFKKNQGREGGFNPQLAAGRNPLYQVVTTAQVNCKRALMEIAAREAGLPVTDEDTDYRLLMVTSAWYGWDHWAITVRTPSGFESIIQTVPDIPVMYGCSTMWDEHFAVHSLNLADLQPQHIAALKTVSPDKRKQASAQQVSNATDYLSTGVVAAGIIGATYWAYRYRVGGGNGNCIII